MTGVFGLYRGVVESNDDPQKRHRLKIRVGEFYTGLNTAALPWAQVACPVYISEVPVGTVVYVCFEKGNTNYPIYIGYTLKYNKDAQCNKCIKYEQAFKCSVYPNDIPDEFYFNENTCPDKVLS